MGAHLAYYTKMRLQDNDYDKQLMHMYCILTEDEHEHEWTTWTTCPASTRAAIFQSLYPSHTHSKISWESPRNPHTRRTPKYSILTPHNLRLFVRCILCAVYHVYLNKHYFRCIHWLSYYLYSVMYSVYRKKSKKCHMPNTNSKFDFIP